MSTARVEVQAQTLQNYQTDGEFDAAMLPEFWGWWFIPVDGGNMERVNLPMFYHFGRALKGIEELKGEDRYLTNMSKIYPARGWLETFIQQTSRMAFPLSRVAANELLEAVAETISSFDALVNDEKIDIQVIRNHKFTAASVGRLQRQLKDFNVIFVRESQRVSVFSIGPKGIYDIEALIERAHESLPDAVVSRLPDEAVEDVKQAGRCLALNSPTAAGFHILRAVESLIRAYHAKVTKKTLTLKSRNWGAYIRDLNAAKADQKVTGYLLHIKDNYRNPIAHPEVTLSADEAFSLFTASLSAITQLDAAILAWP